MARRTHADAGGITDTLFLNGVALLGALLGLANVALAWLLFGSSADVDLWMMALVLSQAFMVLSQLGVEQVAVFSARARAGSPAEGACFDRDCLSWALMFGGGFALLVLWALPLVVSLCAQGFDAPTQGRLATALAPLLLQVAAAPGLYVLRQQLLLDQRARWSVALGQALGALQCLLLLVAWALAVHQPERLAWALGVGSLALTLACVLVLGARGAGRQLPHWQSLLAFVRASAAMRLTHSAHNFLVVLVTNAALSGGLAGSVAMFQSIKRVADGLSSIAVGPHLGVYHAAQATAWTARDRGAFLRHMHSYARTALPLLAAGSALFLMGTLAYGAWTGNARCQWNSAEVALLLLLLAWQTLIAVETVAAGVLALDNRAGWLLLVNAIYILVFFAAVQWLLPRPTSGVGVAAVSLACQLASFGLFSLVAWRLARRHFAGVPHA